MLVALLSAVLFGATQSASCAMHGLGAARNEAAPHAAPASESMDHLAASHQMGGHRHDADRPGCDCTCIGACTMVAPLAIAPTAATIRVALVVPVPHRPLDAEPTRAPPPEPDRLLPFANGPPPSALV